LQASRASVTIDERGKELANARVDLVRQASCTPGPHLVRRPYATSWVTICGTALEIDAAACSRGSVAPFGCHLAIVAPSRARRCTTRRLSHAAGLAARKSCKSRRSLSHAARQPHELSFAPSWQRRCIRHGAGCVLPGGEQRSNASTAQSDRLPTKDRTQPADRSNPARQPTRGTPCVRRGDRHAVRAHSGAGH